MIFNQHSDLKGKHAFLSASTYNWINYDEEKLEDRVRTAVAAQRGTELHNLAFDLIRLGIKLGDTKQTLNAYVNDAIGFQMIPEQILYYSDNCFGTADALSFRDDLLRVHDLKTGVTKTSMHQLEIYAAMFCLEYGIRPGEIKMELRIYQNDIVQVHEPDVIDITLIMEKIKHFDRVITAIRQEV